MRQLVIPLLKRFWRPLLATVLISAIGCCYTIGLSGGYLSLETSIYEYLDSYGYPDAVITTAVTDRSRIAALEAVPGVAAVNARAIADTVLRHDGGRPLSVRFFSMNRGDRQRLHLWSSAESGSADTLYLEYGFAENNGIRAGDTVSVKTGDEWREFFVGGIVSAPETLTVQPTDMGWTLSGDFGYAYISVDLLAREYKERSEAAQDELDEKRQELDTARQDADEQLNEAREKLDEAAELLREKEEELGTARAELQKSARELQQARDELAAQRAALVSQLDQISSGRSSAQSALEQLGAQRNALQEAGDTLSGVDGQLAAVIAQQELLLHPDTQRAVELLELLPANTQLCLVSAALDNFLCLINSACAYGFYYDVNETVWCVAERLRGFMDGVRRDADYFSSAEALSVIERIESGEEGIGDTPEYAALATAVSRYACVSCPEELPGALAFARSATGELLALMDAVSLDAAASTLTAFDAAGTVASLTERINRLRAAVSQLEAAMETSFVTTGDVSAAYDAALDRLAAARAELEAARTQITDALAAQGLTEGELPATMDALDANIRTLRDTLAQLADGEPKLKAGIGEIDTALRRLDGAAVQLEQKRGEFSDAQAQLEEAHAEYEANESEYQKRFADSLLEFASLEEELKEACAALEDGTGYEELCNQFLLWFEEGADPETTLLAAKAALRDVAVKSDYHFADSPVKMRIDANLDPIRTTSTFVPAVYFSILMVVTFLFMSLIVRQSRREIGILRAIGQSVGRIRTLFCGESLIVSLTANLLGLILGGFFTWYVGRKNVRFFTMPVSQICMDWGSVLRCFLANIAVGQLSTWISTGFVVKVSPAEAMTRPAPSTGRVPGRLGGLTRHMKPMTAFSITTLLRNPLRFVVSTVCIAASMMMIFSSLSTLTSERIMIDDIYHKRIQYDGQIFYSGDVGGELCHLLQETGIAGQVQRAPIYLKEISYDGRSETAVITALEPDTQLLRVYDRAGNQLTLPHSENGILLEEHLARRLGADVGDTVLVDGTQHMVVEGLSFQSAERSQYISRAGSGAMEEDIGVILCRVAPEDEEQLLELLMEQEGYLYTIFTRLAYKSDVKQLELYDFIAWVIIAFTVVTGFLIILNTARTNLLEKKKELCILRMQGFQHGEISRSWFVQSVVQYLCSCAIGLPLGRVMAASTLRQFANQQREFVYTDSWANVLFTLGLVALYVVTSHFAAMHDVKGWNVVENVKEKE